MVLVKRRDAGFKTTWKPQTLRSIEVGDLFSSPSSSSIISSDLSSFMLFKYNPAFDFSNKREARIRFFEDLRIIWGEKLRHIQFDGQGSRPRQQGIRLADAREAIRRLRGSIPGDSVRR
jgi:hypothetical protein